MAAGGWLSMVVHGLDAAVGQAAPGLPAIVATDIRNGWAKGSKRAARVGRASS